MYVIRKASFRPNINRQLIIVIVVVVMVVVVEIDYGCSYSS